MFKASMFKACAFYTQLYVGTTVVCTGVIIYIL